MAVFEWSEHYSVGVAEFDAQHQQLVKLLNNLSDAMLAGKGNDTVKSTLNELVNYTATHFAAEERKMKTLGFPGFQDHKVEHDNLVMQAKELQNKVAGGTKPTVQTMQFLKNWLTNHILKTDRGYTAFMNSKGVK